eukprot:scaffold123494_cov36-Phaeocystis_antarctica.AAC.1
MRRPQESPRIYSPILSLPLRSLAEVPLARGLRLYPWRAAECLRQLLAAAVQDAGNRSGAEGKKAAAVNLPESFERLPLEGAAKT